MEEISKRTERNIWKRILGFKVGDKVKIVSCSKYSKVHWKYFLGREGTIDKILFEERLIIVKLEKRVSYKNLMKTFYEGFVASPEDIEYEVEDEGNGSSPMRDSHLQMRDSLCGSPK